MEYLLSLFIHIVLIAIVVLGRPSLGLQLKGGKSISVTLTSMGDLTKAGVAKPDPTRLPPPRWIPPPPPPPKKEEMVFLDKKQAARHEKEKKKELKPNEPDEADKKSALRNAVAQLRQNIDSRPKPRADNYGFGKTEGGGAGDAGGDVSGEDLPFMVRIKERIITNFFIINKNLVDHASGLSTIIRAKVSPDRTIRKLEIEKESGSDYFDRRCEFAIKKSAPFPEIPDDYLKDMMLDGFRVECNPSS